MHFLANVLIAVSLTDFCLNAPTGPGAPAKDDGTRSTSAFHEALLNLLNELGNQKETVVVLEPGDSMSEDTSKLDNVGTEEVHYGYDKPSRYIGGHGSDVHMGLTSDGVDEVSNLLKLHDKRGLDNLGGIEVHYLKRMFAIMRANQNNAGFDRQQDTDRYPEFKRYFDNLGGAFVHPSKRYFDRLGGTEVHGYKRAFDDLGGIQVHGYKRAFDDLGGIMVHGYKRGFDDLGGINVHGYKRSFDDLGGTQVHGYKRGFDNLGGTAVHGYKRGMDQLAGREVNGYKREEETKTNYDKRAFDNLGGIAVHGFKRGLDDLGGIEVHAPKRGLDSPGGIEIHGLKRSVGPRHEDIDTINETKQADPNKD